jgi:NADPH-dependent ferric siderophore reductase
MTIAVPAPTHSGFEGAGLRLREVSAEAAESPFALLRAEVTSVVQLTANVVRMTFGGPELAKMASGGLDQRIKLVLPLPGQDRPVFAGGERDYQALRTLPEDVRPILRSYTVRAHRPARAEFDVDFVLHGVSGPGSMFAMGAKPGDEVAVYVPNAACSYHRRGGVEFRLERVQERVVLLGDETALPAIGSILETLPADVRVDVAVEIPELADVQDLTTRAQLALRWFPRGAQAPGSALVDGIRGLRLPAVEPYVWLAGEAGLVKNVRRYLVRERGISKRAITFMGYWRLGRTGDPPRDTHDQPAR